MDYLVKGYPDVATESIMEPDMTMTLRVLCWDHPRCTGPMAAASEKYSAIQPDVTVSLGTRPLPLFNDQPAWEADAGYDLIFIDHPATGATAWNRALVPVDTVLPSSVLQRIADESIGGSHGSYTWDGHQWALGVDATSQVAALHNERLQFLGAAVPRTWEDVLALAARAPQAVALPLFPSDAMCALISLSANVSYSEGKQPTWLRPEAVEMLVDLAKLVDPSCFTLNPPRMLDKMANSSDVAYVPFVFGYANMARGPLAFTDVAGIDGQPRGAVLGGAGLGIFPSSPHVEEATEFAAWCMDATVQRDVLMPAGAQPGNRRVWDEQRGSGETMAYLHATRKSLESAYVRPRDPWWPPFQRHAGERLTSMLRDDSDAGRIFSELDGLADQYRERSDVHLENRR